MSSTVRERKTELDNLELNTLNRIASRFRTYKYFLHLQGTEKEKICFLITSTIFHIVLGVFVSKENFTSRWTYLSQKIEIIQSSKNMSKIFFVTNICFNTFFQEKRNMWSYGLVSRIFRKIY